MGQASVDRCFYGCIKRLKDDNGNQFVFSRLAMPDGLLCASAPEQQELGDNLDKMCVMICDKGLHSGIGVSIEIFGNDFFLN
jgi:hypothetical protein